ncbi:14616_t:CDS:2, partial [Dentiscutata heterogama]
MVDNSLSEDNPRKFDSDVLDHSLLEISDVLDNLLLSVLSEGNSSDKKQINDNLEEKSHNSVHIKSTMHLSVHDNNYCETAPVCDVDYRDLKILRFVANGGFSDVFKAQWKEKFVAVKYVSRENPIQSRDFDREVASLKKSKNCKKYIIQFFGLAQEVRGVQAYVDPILLDKGQNFNHINEKSSDIYSFGVLMWEIYTCRPPFNGRRDNELFYSLWKGLREKPEIGMPLDYIKIYESCWVPDPSIRPEISKILNDLNNLRPEPRADRIYIMRKKTYNILPIEIQYNPKLPIIIVEDIDDIKIQDENFTKNMQIFKHTTSDIEQSITLETFTPLFEEVCQLENNLLSFCNVQLNTKIFESLRECIMEISYNVKKLKLRNNIDSFATLKNYIFFQKLLQNITNIKDFICKVSQINELRPYVQKTDHGISLKQLKDKYDALLEEFNDTMSSLGFKSQINEQVDVLNDIKETEKFIQTFQCNFKDDNNTMFDLIDQKIIDIQNSAINDFLIPIKFLNELENDDIRHEKYNFSSDSHEMKMLRIQIALLKDLNGLANISKFYGITKDESGSISIYSEWSKHGNLKTYYNQCKSLNVSVKKNFAFDICNGLVFLSAVNILHRNIKSENILITNDHKAKLTNFCYSRLTANDSRKIHLKDNKIGIEYVAPEIVERSTHTHSYPDLNQLTSDRNYDRRSEIY